MTATGVVSTSWPSPDWIMEDSGCWHLFEVAFLCLRGCGANQNGIQKVCVCMGKNRALTLLEKENLTGPRGAVTRGRLWASDLQGNTS